MTLARSSALVSTATVMVGTGVSPICQIGSSGVSGTVEAIDALSSSRCAFVILCLWFGGREGVSRDRFDADTGWAAVGGCFLDLKLYGMVDFDEN